jgi:TetR/AcrR family transcriptional regulator, mexJK operon transcriptional repressor
VAEPSAPRRRGRPAGPQGAELLAIARQAMLELGLGGTTMSEVAARAGISKTSLYAAHESKDALFAAVVRDWTARGRDAMRPALDAFLAAPDLAAGLVDLARTIQAGVLDDQVVRMRRLVAAEADRLPDVAAGYVAESWTRNIAALGGTFAELGLRGALAVGEPLLAAEQFTWLAVGGPLNRQTLGAGPPPAAELDATAHAATATFLSRYGR